MSKIDITSHSDCELRWAFDDSSMLDTKLPKDITTEANSLWLHGTLGEVIAYAKEHFIYTDAQLYELEIEFEESRREDLL